MIDYFYNYFQKLRLVKNEDGPEGSDGVIATSVGVTTGTTGDATALDTHVDTTTANKPRSPDSEAEHQ